MSKWANKLDSIRAMISIGLDTGSIAEALGTTVANLHSIAKRNGVALPGGSKRTAGLVCEIPIRLLRKDPDQPREQFDEASLQALADSLKAEGQESPITFRLSDIEDDPERTPFMVVHGERRCKATVLAGLPTILGVLDIRQDTATDRLLRQISDNEQRENLTPWDWVVSIERLHQEGLTHDAISQALTARGIKGFSRSVVSNYRRLLNLPDSAQQLLQQGKITPAHGKYLLQCKDDGIRAELIASIADDDDSVPTIDQLQRNTLRKYEQTHRGLNCWTHHGDWTDFAWKETCKDCLHCHKVDNDHIFCTNPVDECWDGHQAAARRMNEAEREARQQTAAEEEQRIESVDLEDLKKTDPEEAKRIEGLKEKRAERQREESERERISALEQKISEAAKSTTDIDVLLVCAMQYMLEDIIDWPESMRPPGVTQDEPVTPSQWLERFRQNRIDVLQTMAGDSMRGYIHPDDLPHYAAMLGLDPDTDYREQPTNDIEEAAA